MFFLLTYLNMSILFLSFKLYIYCFFNLFLLVMYCENKLQNSLIGKEIFKDLLAHPAVCTSTITTR